MRTLSKSENYFLASAWLENIQKALAHRKRFADQYRDAQRYAFESHDFVFDDVEGFDLRSTVPKAWEMLSIFGPLLAFKEPRRTSRVRYPRPGPQGEPDPREAFTRVSQDLLNYSANELKLKAEAREAVDESILAAGVMWLEVDRTTGLVGHFSGGILDLLIDPDAEMLRDAWWIARRHMMPRWEAAELFGVEIDSEDLPSGGEKSIVDIDFSQDRQTRAGEEDFGKTNELLEVWEVWSRMGIGYRLKAMSKSERRNEVARSGDDYADECHFYLVKGGRKLFDYQDDWPIPLYLDNAWPCSLLFYKKRRDYVWPVSVMGPSLGLQKAIDWMATMILNKIKTTSRDFIAVLKGLDEDIKDKVRNGGDLEVLEISSSDLPDGTRVNDLISFLKHSPMNTDVWHVWEMLLDLFEKASGLYAALYGDQGRTQARSAEEIKERRNRTDLRPQDMRERVEDWHSDMARKEMIAMRLLYSPEMVAEILGPEAAQIWGEYQEGDLTSAGGGSGRIMREYDYRIEASSTERPDAQKERDDSMELFDRAMQVAINAADLNAANRLLANLQDAMGVPEDRRVTIQPAPPEEPPPDPTVELKLAIEQVKLEIEKLKLEAQEAKTVEAQAKAGMKQTEASKAGEPEPSERLAGAMLEGGGPEDVIAIRNGQPVRRGEAGVQTT